MLMLTCLSSTDFFFKTLILVSIILTLKTAGIAKISDLSVVVDKKKYTKNLGFNEKYFLCSMSCKSLRKISLVQQNLLERFHVYKTCHSQKQVVTISNDIFPS